MKELICAFLIAAECNQVCHPVQSYAANWCAKYHPRRRRAAVAVRSGRCPGE